MQAAKLIHRREMTPVNFNRAFSALSSLTEKELIALEHLRKVTGDSIWTDPIREITRAQTLSVEKFRLLVSSLLSQGNDNPLAMQRIIGTDCYNSLLAVLADNQIRK